MKPILRFSDFNTDWKIVKLQELLSFNNGINASKDQYGIGRKFINVLDILNNDFITYNNIIGKVDVSEDIELNNKVEYGDMLFLRSSETREDVGIANTYLDDKYALFGGFVIRGKRIKEYSPLFLKETLNKSRTRYEIGAAAGGSTRFNVNQDILKNVMLYLPELEEQRKISDFITKLDYQIDLAQKKLNLLEQQKKGYMQKIFSQELRFKDDNGNDYPDWEETTIKNITNYISSKKSSNQYTESNNSEGYPVYDAVQEIGKDLQYDMKEPYISILKDGAGAGRLNLRAGKSSVIGTMGYIQANNVDIQFLYYRMKLLNFRKFIIGSTIPHLYYKDYSKEKILIPKSNDEQKKIGHFIMSIDKLIDNKTLKLDYLKQHKKGLLQKIFV